MRAKLPRPLDFLVVTDHAEGLGVAPMIAESNPVILKDPLGRKLHELVKAGKPDEAYNAWRAAKTDGTNTLMENKEMVGPAWKRITAAAEKYNEPGRFTALIGFEWTSDPKGNNLHRNVIFRLRDLGQGLIWPRGQDQRDVTARVCARGQQARSGLRSRKLCRHNQFVCIKTI